MLQWFRERNSPRHDAAEPAVLSPSHAARSINIEALPSKQDRLIMLRAVLFAADTLQSRKYGDEQRLRKVLQDELIVNACVALHLAKEDDDEQHVCFIMANAASLDPSLSMEQPFACITLLLSNIVLQYGSKGGYDSRVRHTLKTACVHILYTNVEKSLESSDEKTNAMDAFDESVGGIFRAQQNDAGEESGDSGAVSGDEQKKDEATDQANGDDNGNKEEFFDLSNDDAAFTEVALSMTEEDSQTQALTIDTHVDTDHTLTERQSHIQYIVTRKFELIERAIATRIFRVLVQENASMKVTDGERTTMQANENNKVRKRVVRGLQITGVGVVAGTLFAVTGGLAGPAIAAGIAGLGVVSSTSAAAAIALLTTVKAAAALFGVGGGGLAAYKMKKRTQGLTEFYIRRENIEQSVYEGASDETIRRGIQASLPQLHTTICISGWLKDKSDYQRPWGIQPTDPPIQDKMELLKRFFTVHDPELVGSCEDVIKQRKKRERKAFSWEVVWCEIEEQYGRNPDHLLPLDSKNTDEITLTIVEQRSINDLLCKVVLIDRDPTIAEEKEETGVETKASSASGNHFSVDAHENKANWKWLWFGGEHGKSSDNDSASSDKSKEVAVESSSGEPQSDEDGPQNTSGTESAMAQKTDKQDEGTLLVWDWQALYGGDLHTITWESGVLLHLCHIVSTMGFEVTSQATRFALQFSVIGAIMAAVAVPSALLTASKMIDDPYQIVILRADEAGVELAKCLLQSEERRPVTLVGYSFGARVIYSCLMELARHQKLWEKKHGLIEEDKEHGSSFFRQEGDESESMEYTREPASIVEDVIFMGLPRRIDSNAFRVCRRVAGGRMVNCYTKNDWFLSLMFIARAGTQTAGTSPIENVDGIENYNVTDLVEAHANYPDAVAPILQRVNFGKPNALSSWATEYRRPFYI